MVGDIAVHLSPVWRERANFIIVARITDDELPHAWEQLWARQIDHSRFEICCIPFFLYDIALGDEVETADQEGKNYVVQRVLKDSGHYTFRVWFGSSSSPAALNDVIEKVAKLGCALEWSSKSLLGVDAESSEAAQKLANFLDEREQLGELFYETGRTK
jgi:hypothetical protein